LEKQLEKFIGTEISFPENMQANLQGRDTLILSNALMKMVVWYDSIVCSSCHIQQIHEWNEIVQYADSIGDVFDLVFIFSSKARDLYNVNIAMRKAVFKHPVYIDKGNYFHKNNPDIPSDNRLHTFLLDVNNKVILVGNPLYNKTLWELYKEQIQTKLN